MKIRLAFIAIIFFAFGALMLSQIHVVNAQSSERKPLTAPISYFFHNISGRVTYVSAHPHWILRAFSRAENVKIEAIPVESAPTEVVSATTDSNGNYTLTVAQGLYMVRASDLRGTIFEPRRVFVDVRIRDVSGINFQGRR